MPYGQGQSIGSTVNPGLFTQDYSGFANAGAMQGAMMLGIGQAVGDIGKAIGERKKEQTQKEKEIKMAENIAGMIEQTMPDIAPNVASIRASLGDRNIPLDMRHADAQSIMEVLNIGVMGKRMKMEQEEMDLRRMDTYSTVNSRNVQSSALSDEISDARNQREAQGKTRSAIGPALLQSVMGLVPPTVGDSIDISQYTPEQQYDLAKVLESTIAPDRKLKLVENMKATINGQAAELPVMVDERTGQAYPVQLAGQMGVAVDGSAGVLPPKPGQDGPPADIQTNEGALLPANEAQPYGNGTDAEGNPVTLYRYNGMNYTAPAPKQAGGVSLGSIGGDMTPTEKIAVEKFKQEQQAKTEASGAAQAKSERMFALLDQLDKHPGFSGLFGFGVGARMIPGTDAAGAETLFNQIDAMGFIEAIKDMKGMGALSNAEGEKVSAALVGMNPKMPEKEARAKIAEIKQYIQKGQERMKSGQLVNPDGTLKPAPQTPRDIQNNATSRLRGLPRQ